MYGSNSAVSLCLMISSSIKAVEKREGSGGYNWGTVHDDLNAM